MEQELYKDDIEIDINELFGFILSKIVLVIFMGVTGAALMFGYTKFMVTPMYTSTTEVYILTKPEENMISTGDMAISSALAKDLPALMVSEPVLKGVIEELNLNTTVKSLGSTIKIKQIEETRVLKIDVIADNPEKAKKIADSFRNNAKKECKDMMAGIEAINAIDEASLPNGPSSPNLIKNVAIGFAGGSFLIVLILVIIFLMDDTIKTQEDIEKYLGISVLASIPVQLDHNNGNKKKSKKKKEA